MAQSERLICASEEVAEGGAGFRFAVTRFGREEPAFAVRFHGRVYAYMNRCGHVPVELDWQHGEFFDTSKLYLICATHGALYSPESGHCLGGRCNGKGLEPVTVIERNGKIFLTPTE
jgi:nitrite reductase/ring-hydroxylating ferredoxin subunit